MPLASVTCIYTGDGNTARCPRVSSLAGQWVCLCHYQLHSGVCTYSGGLDMIYPCLHASKMGEWSLACAYWQSGTRQAAVEEGTGGLLCINGSWSAGALWWSTGLPVKELGTASGSTLVGHPRLPQAGVTRLDPQERLANKEVLRSDWPYLMGKTTLLYPGPRVTLRLKSPRGVWQTFGNSCHWPCSTLHIPTPNFFGLHTGRNPASTTSLSSSPF